MRVCILAVAGYVHGIGGMQQHTVDLAVGLVRAGHEVEVVTARHPDGDELVERDGVRWHFVDAPPRHMDRRWRTKSLERFLQLHGERPFDVVHGEGSSALELLRTGVHEQVPVVTLFHGNFLGLARAGFRRAISSRRPRPALSELRGVIWLCGQHFPHGNWRRFRSCEAMVPSTQQLRDTRRSHRLDQRRLHVVPNGIDTHLFRPIEAQEARLRLGLPRGPLLVSVGRLSSEKGVHHAVTAVARLRDRSCDASLVVVGDGAEREALERLARELHVEDRTIFVGAQTPELVAHYLGAADIFVFPTERDEAAPLVLPQAMACGIAVAASRIGGIEEVLNRPGPPGILLRPGDPDDLTETLHRLIANQDERVRLGICALEVARAEYSVEVMTERTVFVYETARRRFEQLTGSRRSRSLNRGRGRDLAVPPAGRR
jgi:glycosyltransferase involved in cell wall biosynthesis